MSKVKCFYFIILLLFTVSTNVFGQKGMCLTDLVMAKSRATNCEKCFALVLSKKLTWEAGDKIKVSFLNGNADTQAKVRQYAEQWETYANVDFVFGNFSNADIKISFQDKGYWSFVGTESKQHSPSMSLTGLNATTPDDEISRVVLHEFGHALGLMHEHQHKNRPFEWNLDAVYKEYSNWDRETIRINLIEKYDDENTYTNFVYDPNSIMHYPISSHLTTNGYSVSWNRYLSNNDKSLISKIYPKSREENAGLVIDTPPNGQTVGLVTQVTGKTSSPELNHYLLVISTTAQRYFIQDPVQVSKDGAWTGRAAFGTTDYGIGHQWVIWVLTTKSRLSVGEIFDSGFPADAKLSQPVVVIRNR